MTTSHPSVLMVQANRLQGFIWKTALKTQQISVIWEAPDTDLKATLTQLDQAGMTLPHLLIVDIQCLGDNPYVFCRWCRNTYSDVKIILTKHTQRAISVPERDWAIYQGASDVLLGFQQDNLVGSAILCIKRVLELLKHDQMNGQALLSALFKLEQELKSRQVKNSASLEINLKNGQLPNQQVVNEQLQEQLAFSLDEHPGRNGQLPQDHASGNLSSETEQKTVRRQYRGVWY